MSSIMRKAAVIGWPVEHSRSPLIHRHWLKEQGLNGDYHRLAIAPENIDRLKAILIEEDYVGGNVTIPHKEAAFRLADHADEVAHTLGAANTLWFEGGRLFASNTDGYGFLANLDEKVPGWDAKGGKAIVLGAGGAARAIVWALLQRKFDSIYVLNRTLEKAETLVDRFGSRLVAKPLSDIKAVLKHADFLVNTTAVGMHGATQFEFSLAGMRDTAIVNDIVYTPLTTGLLRDATARNLRTVDGLGMLLHQAAPGFEQWFGKIPTISEALRQIIVDDLGAAA